MDRILDALRQTVTPGAFARLLAVSALLIGAAACSNSTSGGGGGGVPCADGTCPAGMTCGGQYCFATSQDVAVSPDAATDAGATATDTGPAPQDADASPQDTFVASQDTAVTPQDTAVTPQDTGSGDQDTQTIPDTTGTVAAGYKSIVIYDKYTEPDCNKTSGPGPDIDMIAAWRGNDLLGVGKVGSCNYSAAQMPACLDNKHATAADVKAACGPFGDLDFKSISTGYLSLGGGSLELAIGACTSTTTDIEACDGAGAVVELQAGDQLDVYEVDQWYLGNKPDGTKDPKLTEYITGACVCISETYEVWVRPTTGVDTGSVQLGQQTGTGTLDVK